MEKTIGENILEEYKKRATKYMKEEYKGFTNSIWFAAEPVRTANFSYIATDVISELTGIEIKEKRGNVTCDFTTLYEDGRYKIGITKGATQERYLGSIRVRDYKWHGVITLYSANGEVMKQWEE